MMKKDVKSKVAAKKLNGCDGRKIHIVFCIGFGTEFTWIVVIKFFAFNLHLATTFDFTLATHSFYSLAVLD